MSFDVHGGVDIKLRNFIKRSSELHSKNSEIADQIMTAQVHTTNEDKHIVELASRLSNAGMHHIPIIDKERRLAGIVTQLDLVAALHRGHLVEPQVG